MATSTFVGREAQLRELTDGLAVQGRVAVSAIHGIGGVGKTQLAAYYANTHRNEYDLIWWVRAEQPETLRADLAALAARLGLADALAADEQVAVDAARDWLARHDRWLVVFDNAPDPGAVGGLLVEGGGGHVVITSRAHADWRAVGALSLSLDVWEREESLAFLRARTSVVSRK